jgi:hypothetical protein
MQTPTPLRFLVASLAILALAAAPGCGKKDDKKDDSKSSTKNGGNTQPAAKSAKELLVGTWNVEFQVDEAKARSLMKGKVPENEVENQIQGLKAMAKTSRMTVVMNADGTTTSESTAPNPETGQMATEKDKGTWKVTAEDGRKATFVLVTRQGEDRQDHLRRRRHIHRRRTPRPEGRAAEIHVPSNDVPENRFQRRPVETDVGRRRRRHRAGEGVRRGQDRGERQIRAAERRDRAGRSRRSEEGERRQNDQRPPEGAQSRRQEKTRQPAMHARKRRRG